MITTRAPGKLFIAGEYAVVEPGEPAVLVAVDRHITVRLTSGDSGHSGATGGSITSTHYGPAPLPWSLDPSGTVDIQGQDADPVSHAMGVVAELCRDRAMPFRGFDLEITSTLVEADGRKFGLGSSAAVTVAVIAAVARHQGLEVDLWTRFQLACLATIALSPRASCGDVAASTYGGWIHYTSPDRRVLHTVQETGGVAAALASPGWDRCSITPLPTPTDLHLLVGWTGSPAATDRMVAGVRPTGDHLAATYPTFLQESRSCVEDLTSAIRSDQSAATAALRRARGVMQRLGEATGISIETDLLRLLCDVAEEHGAAAKPSGAGGGDCGVSLSHGAQPVVLSDILHEWEAGGILPLPLNVHPAEGRTR